MIIKLKVGLVPYKKVINDIYELKTFLQILELEYKLWKKIELIF